MALQCRLFDLCCRTSWLSYYRLLGMPVLVGLNAADTALDIEALSDKQAVAEAMQVCWWLTLSFMG